jgi:hypothetical protein
LRVVDAEIRVWHHFSEPTDSGQGGCVGAKLSQVFEEMLSILSNLDLAIALQ